MYRPARWVDVDDEAPDPKSQPQQQQPQQQQQQRSPYSTLTKLVGEFDRDIAGRVGQVNDITNLQVLFAPWDIYRNFS